MNMRISIKDLSVTTIIGIYPEERQTPQELLFDIDLVFDGKTAADSDNINQTIDYYQLAEDIVDFVEHTSYNLLERLINEIADLIMKNPRTLQCSVKATKPKVFSKARAISLSVKKER